MRRQSTWRILLTSGVILALITQATSMRAASASGHLGAAQRQAVAMAQPHDYTPPPQRPWATNLPATLVHSGVALVAFRTPVYLAAGGTRVALSDAAAASRIHVDSVSADAFNGILDGLGTTNVEHLFAGLDATRLASARARAEAATGAYVTDFTQVYLVHFDPAINPGDAANRLARSPLVSSAMPNFKYHVPQRARAVSPAARPILSRLSRVPHARVGRRVNGLPPQLPDNYGYVSDGQSYHDAASNDVTGAFAMIRDRFGDQPGQGQIVTNISLGNINDRSTVLERGQRYLEYRGFPRIPVYLASGGTDPVLNPTATTQDDQGDFGEVLLDFSVMAPPPTGDLRVPNQQASGQLGNILGAAYGAQYRLINPLVNGTSDFLAAFLGGGQQTPAPTIMTASIGDGIPQLGFSDYFFEQETLIHDAVVLEEQGNDIFVTISAGDGQTNTDSAMNPNGVTGPTEVTTDTSRITDINEFNWADPNYSYFLTFEPQYVIDSGANDAGADTLNDIFNNSPSNTAIDARTRHGQHTTETRWTGQQNFHSGNGSRVNLSAPGDDVLYLAQSETITPGVPNNPVDDQPELIGGTSASSPEIAAAAAVVRGVATHLGHPLSAVQARQELIDTARINPIPAFDLDRANVGPELDLTRAVADLFSKYGQSGTPALVRMTVSQRKAIPYGNGYGRGFYSDTPQDPSARTATIDLSGGLIVKNGAGFNLEEPAATGDNINAPLTFAVDGMYLPASTTYRWSFALGSGASVALPAAQYTDTLPYVRLLPSEIFGLLGQPLTALGDRVVNVTVTTNNGLSTTLAVTFKGQTSATYTHAVSPSFNPVFRPSSSADGITVTYNLRNLRSGAASTGGAYPTVDGGVLLISDIDRALPRAFSDRNVDAHGCKVPLAGLTGTVTLTPTNPLVVACLGRGVGTYGLALRGVSGGKEIVGSTSSWIPLRYAPALEAHPATPKVQAAVSAQGGTAPLFYDIANTQAGGGSAQFTVTYDTAAVPGATGAIVEFSAPTPDLAQGLFITGNLPDANKFTNPYGDRLDGGNNLGQPGESYHTTVNNTAGALTLDGGAIGLYNPAAIPAGSCDLAYQVRLFATNAQGRIVGVAGNPSIIDFGDFSTTACGAKPTATATPAVSGTATVSGTPPPVTGTPTVSSTATVSASATVSATGTVNSTATASATGTVSGTATVSATATVSGTATVSATGTSAAVTGTSTSTKASATSTPTAAPATATGTPVPATSTSTSTEASATSTSTPVPATSTATGVPATSTSTSTPVPPTSTGTSTPAPATSTSTGTAVPATSTGTAIPATSTGTAVPATGTPTETAGSPTASPSPVCQLFVSPVFDTVPRGGEQSLVFETSPGAPLTVTIRARYPTQATLFAFGDPNGGGASLTGTHVPRGYRYTFRAGSAGLTVLLFAIPRNARQGTVAVDVAAKESCGLFKTVVTFEVRGAAQGSGASTPLDGRAVTLAVVLPRGNVLPTSASALLRRGVIRVVTRRHGATVQRVLLVTYHPRSRSAPQAKGGIAHRG